nr:hypothetical protein [Tanacetum cinerariifolium]
MGANEGIEGVNGNVDGANEEAPDFSTIIAQQLHNLLPENVRNVLVNDNRVGCSYKKFLACNPKEYDGFNVVELSDPHAKPGSCCQKIERYVYGLAPHIRRMVAVTEPKTMQISGALTDEAVRNGSIKKVEKRGNVGEPSKDKNGRDNNKRTRTGNIFSTTVNPVGRENAIPRHLAKDYRGVPRNMNPVNARNPPGRACYECGSTDHVRPACPRLNRAQGLGGNCPNQVVANNRGQGHGTQENQAKGRAFMLGAEEAR